VDGAKIPKRKEKNSSFSSLIPERDGNSTLAIPIQQGYHVSQ